MFLFESVLASIALISILVSLKGIFSGNFSLVIATSKQSPKSICRILPLRRSNIRFEGCLQRKIENTLTGIFNFINQMIRKIFRSEGDRLNEKEDLHNKEPTPWCRTVLEKLNNLLGRSTNYWSFMEPGCLACSQESTTGPYPVPHEFSQHFMTYSDEYCNIWAV